MGKAFFSGIASAIIIFLNASFASANVGDLFGYGPRSAAMGGAGVVGHQDAYDALMNPALSSSRKNSSDRVRLSASIIFLQPKFDSIKDIVVVNDITGDLDLGSTTKGSVLDDYKDTMGTLLGISAVIDSSFWNWSVGVTTFFPLAHLAYIDSGEGFIPEYVLYRSRSQRPQIEFGTAFAPNENWSFGFGARMAYSLTTKADVFLQGDSSLSSTMRFSTIMRPRFIPEAGVVWASDDRKTQFGAVVRLASRSPSVLNLNSSARLLGNLARLNFGFSSKSSIYYDPMTVELGGSFHLVDRLKTILQFDYQRWSDFDAPSLSLDVNKSQGVTISGTSLPLFRYQDVFIPRAGFEWDLDRSNQGKIRWGYSYRTGMIRGTNSDGGNYLDPSKHIFGLGYGFYWPHFLGMNQGATLDFSGEFQKLKSDRIQKNPGNELGQGTGDLKIGAPGYNTGGFLWGFSTGVTVEL